MISIAGLDKVDVLIALYNHASPRGLGILHYVQGPLPRAEAEKLLRHHTRFDYINGRAVKVSLTLRDEFDPVLYDHCNGDGAAKRVIDALRAAQKFDPVLSSSVLLLDADGVISPHRPLGEDSGLATDPCCALTRVIAVTNCKIVLSSAWRYKGHGRNSILGQCLHYALREWPGDDEYILRHIIGALPIEEPGCCPVDRDVLIQRWVDKHKPGRWVAVDDLECIERLGEGHFVRTNGEVGLTKIDAQKLIELLGR